MTVQTGVRSTTENLNKNKSTEKEAVLADENIYLDKPSHIRNNNHVSNSSVINKTF